MTDTFESFDALAYPPAQAAKVTGRSHTRIKKAIREKELTARKDGRATLIERAELQRWLASLPTIGRAFMAPPPKLRHRARQKARGLGWVPGRCRNAPAARRRKKKTPSSVQSGCRELRKR